MEIEVYGLDHRSSSSLQRRDIYSRLDNSGSSGSFFVTCNRLESYGYQDAPSFEYSYHYRGQKQVRGHLLSLACGLLSQLIGERQIIRQLDKFSVQAEKHLGRLIREAISDSQRIREKFSLNTDKSLADALFSDVQKHGLLGAKTVVVGSGAVARLIGSRFKEQAKISFVSGKKISLARRLADLYGGEAFERKDINRVLEEAKVLICATDCPHYVITKEHNIGGCRIYDLSSPQRNVHPDLNAIGLEELDGEISLLNDAFRERALKAHKLIREEYGI